MNCVKCERIVKESMTWKIVSNRKAFSKFENRESFFTLVGLDRQMSSKMAAIYILKYLSKLFRQSHVWNKCFFCFKSFPNDMFLCSSLHNYIISQVRACIFTWNWLVLWFAQILTAKLDVRTCVNIENSIWLLHFLSDFIIFSDTIQWTELLS